METGPAPGEAREPDNPAGSMRQPPPRDNERARRNDSLRAQLAGTTLPDIPGWLDDAGE